MTMFADGSPGETCPVDPAGALTEAPFPGERQAAPYGYGLTSLAFTQRAFMEERNPNA